MFPFTINISIRKIKLWILHQISHSATVVYTHCIIYLLLFSVSAKARTDPPREKETRARHKIQENKTAIWFVLDFHIFLLPSSRIFCVQYANRQEAKIQRRFMS